MHRYLVRLIIGFVLAIPAWTFAHAPSTSCTAENYGFFVTEGSLDRWVWGGSCVIETGSISISGTAANFCVAPISGSGSGTLYRNGISHTLNFSWVSDGLSWISFTSSGAGGLSGTYQINTPDGTPRTWCTPGTGGYWAHGTVTHS